MKQIRRALALAMIALLAVTMLCGAAMAASKNDKIADLQRGKWYSAGEYTVVYKLKLTKDSLLTATWKNNTNDDLNVDVYKDSACKKWAFGVYSREKTSGTQTNALAKGTYYTTIEDYSSKSKIKFTVAKLVDKQNYCPGRALKVKRNTKTITGAHTPMNNPGQDWFKITLTKQQKLTIITDTGFITDNMYVYDSDFEGVNMETYGSLTKKSAKKLPAGTYYIDIHNDCIFGRESVTGTFLWK